jgi:predicted dienelactone hydrolase
MRPRPAPRSARLALGLALAFSLIAACDSTSQPGADASPDAESDAVSDASPDTAPDADPDQGPDVAAPSLTLKAPVDAAGPFRVGYRSFEHRYTPAGLSEERAITLHIWYPTEATSGKHPTYNGFFPDEEALENAPAAGPLDASYPVHVHSHGHQGFGGTSAFLMRRFASHGWVAIAPDHVGDLLGAHGDSGTIAHYIKRPGDISASLDALAALPANDPLARVDVSRVIMSGHSRGCHTVWSVVGASFDPDAGGLDPATPAELAVFAQGFRDPRVVAAIPMAGTYSRDWFGVDGYKAASVPMLALTGSEDNAASARFRFDNLPGADLTWVELAGGCHQTFALGFCDTLQTEEGFGIVDAYAMAFARVTLLGDTDAKSLGILEGTTEVSAKATLHRAR